MLDLNYIRKNPEEVKEGCKNKGEVCDVDKVIELDKKRREYISEIDDIRHQKNLISEQIGEKVRAGEDIAPLKQEAQKYSDKEKELNKDLASIKKELKDELLQIPNVPSSDVPVGKSEEDNKVIRYEGEKSSFSFSPRDHLELGNILDLVDLERAAKVAGSFFPLYKGKGAMLKRALTNFMLDFHLRENDYLEVSPPFLVNEDAMVGTGQLPKLKRDMYSTSNEDFYLIPTAEVPITNMHREEILDFDDLPIKYCALTPCFRREAGAYGKETRGLTRIHQFDKVELVCFSPPNQSQEIHETLLKESEEILKQLGLHYRVALLSTGDLSFAASKCYDLEVWAPGTEKFLEVSSCSNFKDFQARRANIRYRPSSDKKPEYLHTLNSSGLALPRLIIALLETYQTSQGTIKIPEVLQDYIQIQEIS